MSAIPFDRESADQHRAAMTARFLATSPDTAGRLTDLNVGSNVRITFDALGVRLEHLDAKAWLGLARAIPQALFDVFGDGDGITTSIGFPLRPAVPASGPVRLFRDPNVTPADLIIPAGTRLQVPPAGTTPARAAVTLAPAFLAAAAASVDTLALAALPGTTGNAPANAYVLVDTLVGVASGANPVAWVNGSPLETDEARRVRFVQWFTNLARAQAAGLEAGAMRAQIVVGGVVTELVTFARAITVPEQRGLVRIYLDNGGGTASSALVAAAQAIIDGSRLPDGTRVPGYKALGIEADVFAVTSQAVDVGAAIVVTAGFDGPTVQAAAVAALTGYVADLGQGDFIVADVIATLAGVRGVRDVLAVTPSTNVLASLGVRLMPGTITVTWAAA